MQALFNAVSFNDDVRGNAFLSQAGRPSVFAGGNGVIRMNAGTDRIDDDPRVFYGICRTMFFGESRAYCFYAAAAYRRGGRCIWT